MIINDNQYLNNGFVICMFVWCKKFSFFKIHMGKTSYQLMDGRASYSLSDVVWVHTSHQLIKILNVNLLYKCVFIPKKALNLLRLVKLHFARGILLHNTDFGHFVLLFWSFFVINHSRQIPNDICNSVEAECQMWLVRKLAWWTDTMTSLESDDVMIVDEILCFHTNKRMLYRQRNNSVSFWLQITFASTLKCHVIGKMYASMVKMTSL